MIKRLQLSNVRTFENSTFEFSEGVNLVIGSNGSGKTTLLESIGLFAFGKFLSVDHDYLVVRPEAQAGRIEASFDFLEQQKASVGLSIKEKIVEIDGRKASVSDLIGLQPQIFFNPETVDIVGGSPVLRRRELDVLALEIDHRFVIDMLNYKKVLKERNVLLRRIASGSARVSEIDFWDEKLSTYALRIYEKRHQLIDFYNENIGEIFKNLSNRDGQLRLKYVPSCDYERFSEVLSARTEADAQTGSTSVGPHRDDFAFIFLSHPMREGASRGEQRLAAVAFKALSREYLLESGVDPIIILDDVFSELDKTRRESVANVLNLSTAKQVFISATDENVIPERLLSQAHVVRV